MQSTITQISNVFNLMVQADPRLEFYHFGWRSDVNRNIDNNFDQGTTVGRKFPAVQFHVPENTSISQNGLDYLGIKEDVQITLYFDDLQDYNNDSSSKTDTLLEQWTNLKGIAEDFVLNFQKVIVEKYGLGFIDSEIKFIPRSNLHNDKLITWEVTFQLTHTTPCTLEENKIDLDAFPECLKEFDIENYCKQIPLCKSLSLDGIDEFIKAPLNPVFDKDINDAMSFEAWVYVNASGAFQFILSKYFSIQPEAYGYVVYLTPTNEVGFTLQYQTSFADVNILQIETNATLNLSQWYHIVVTYDGSTNASGSRIYIDKVSQAYTILQDTLTGSMLNNECFQLGGQINSITGQIGSNLNGYLNFVRAWSVELNQDDVDQLFDKIENIPLKGCHLFFNSANGSGAEWDNTGMKFLIPDLTGITIGYETVNMEEIDLIDECPKG